MRPATESLPPPDSLHGMMLHMIRRVQQSFGTLARLFGTGFFMGSADLVPGVSGGTVALICGIYEKLLASIKVVTGDAPKAFLQGDVRAAWSLVPFSFLVPLGLGILTALFALAQVLSWALAEHPIYIWSFFFGLILASTYVVLSRTTLRTFPNAIGFLLGITFGYVIVGMLPVETPQTWWMVFLSGIIAISAMILPGISGSFMLVILGQYEHILSAVTAFRIDLILILATGCVLGLAMFSHLLSWLLMKYHDIMLAFLAGLMLGSLRKIWPWKEAVTADTLDRGAHTVVIEHNVLPTQIDAEVLLAIVLCVVGAGIVFTVHRHQTHRATGDHQTHEMAPPQHDSPDTRN